MDDVTARRIFDKLEELHTIAVQTKSDAAHASVLIAKLDYTVHGNGVPGLDERVRNLEANQQMATSAAMKVAQWLMPVALTVMGAGAIAWIKDALGMAVNK